jgi:predicted AAA+ superfamily ATPase
MPTALPTYLPRHVDRSLRDALSSAAVVVLDGPRAVGKTTTASRVAASSVLLPRDRDQLNVDAESYLGALTPPVLIDEWQLAGPDLLWTVKRIVDADPQPGRFLLTGSVEPAAYGPTYPLTGRAVRVVMRPMTGAELSGRGNEETFLDRLTSGWRPSVGSTIADDMSLSQLGRVGFPAARDMPNPRLFLDAYASLVSQRAGEEGRDATRLLRTMRVLAALTGQAVPDQRVWEAADVSKVAWKHYEDLLTRVHLSAAVPAYETDRLTRLTTYPKRFLADTALALALADRTVEELAAEPSAAGHFLESYVVQQLRPQADLVGASLMHVRTGAGEREVDLVLETNAGTFGMEVKLARRASPADAKQLAWLRDRLGDSFLHGFVLHTGSDCYSLGERLLALPIGLLITA